jgi:hypothetical protein
VVAGEEGVSVLLPLNGHVHCGASVATERGRHAVRAVWQ